MPIKYMLIIEHPNLDKKLRRQLKLKIDNHLPFRLDDQLIINQVITSFDVVDLIEWADRFPPVRISEVEKTKPPI